MLEFITFLLAPIGYAGLTFAAVRAASGSIPLGVWRAAAAIIVTHVILVWTVRYGGRLSEATRNGYVGFTLFHGALLAILGSLVAGERVARALIIGAFGVVTVGAIGASFRYDVVAAYRIPVVVCAVVGGVGLFRAYRARRRHAALAA